LTAPVALIVVPPAMRVSIVGEFTAVAVFSVPPTKEPVPATVFASAFGLPAFGFRSVPSASRLTSDSKVTLVAVIDPPPWVNDFTVGLSSEFTRSPFAANVPTETPNAFASVVASTVAMKFTCAAVTCALWPRYAATS
jgi:hypothetical protein